jgi:DNA-binding HxlR family transcriptional regulator/uncharacterized protein (DUF1778 family)
VTGRKEEPRKASQKMPWGKTRAIILAYIIANPSTTFTNIKKYLVDTYNVRNNKLIRDALEKLVDEGLITRTDYNRGYKTYYSIKEGFQPLKDVFNYFNDNDYEKSIIQTAYFKDYITSDDFRLKFIVNVFRETMSKFDRIIHNDKDYERLKDRLDVAPENEKLVKVLEKTKNNDNSEWVKTYHKIIDDLQSSIDEYLHIIERRFREKDPDRDPLQFITYLGYEVIPTAERDRIFIHLTTSPSAIDFAFNPKYYDKLIVWDLLAAYTGSTILTEPRRFKETMEADWEKDKDSTVFIKILDFMYEDIDLYAILDKAPITAILEAMMITDLIKGNIIITNKEQKNWR